MMSFLGINILENKSYFSLNFQHSIGVSFSLKTTPDYAEYPLTIEEI